ncbi:aldo/keto reductase [Fibrella sp. HMF5335]|uniref:Aldo/keto reductase n=1 Tax=Fibrella rubiginis TaxID=2817060 RepID=A0A939GHI6_9BACT|nr:aldo/keto reductase [Fibrella rubiginis]MBO0937580.1 aldo/keto reductase [Fibrella rubiginis]
MSKPDGAKTVAQLGIGTWQFGGPNYQGDKPTGWGEIDESTAIRTLITAIDGGVRFIDTADSYGAGQSETWVGNALRQSTAQGITVCTKFGNRRDATGLSVQDYSPAYLVEAVDASLRRLQRDTLDVLLLHSPPDNFDWATYDPQPYEALKQAGKIGAYGVSSRSVYGAKRVMEAGFGSVLEVIYNALDRRAEDILWADPRADAYRFIARVPLASGFLSSRYLHEEPVFPIDQYRHYLPDRDRNWLLNSSRQLQFLDKLDGGLSVSALRFCLSNSAVSAVIPGARNVDQVQKQALAAKLGPLPIEIINQIRQAVPDVPAQWKPAF